MLRIFSDDSCFYEISFIVFSKEEYGRAKCNEGLPYFFWIILFCKSIFLLEKIILFLNFKKEGAGRYARESSTELEN
jgi:hypothetical protein